MKRLLCALAALCLATVAQAQVDRATIGGTIQDEQGGAVSGATVTVTNLATNVASHVRTSAEGTYLAINLAPGRYRVQVEMPGFDTRAEAVILDIGQRARLDLTLKVGTLTEAVEVVEARRLLNTDQASLGTVLDQNTMSNAAARRQIMVSSLTADHRR